MMRRVLKYIPAIILALSSCSRERLQEAPAASADDHCIVLTFGNVHPSAVTKAGTIRGVNDLNENLVQRVDCFFYPTGATSSDAVFAAIGRGAEVVEVEPDSLEYKVKIFYTEDDALRIFGSTTSGTCEAYVICNAPLSYGSSTSVDDLKEMVLEHDFSAQTVMGNFVMHADAPFTVTLSTTGDVTTGSGRVNVSRSAAKIQLYMDIPDMIWDSENQKYWYPMLDNPGSDIRMRYLVKRGKIDGTYAPGSSDLVTTPFRQFYELATENLVPGRSDYNYTHSPFYTYPTTWHDLSNDAPFFVFRIPWRMEGSGSYEYRLYQLSPNLAGKVIESNHFYRSYVRVNTLGGVDEEHTVVISDCSYIIIPWLEEGTNAGQGIVPAEFMDYKFLVIGVPDVELNNEVTATFDYVSSSDITDVNITKIIYYDNSLASPKRELTSGTDFNNAKNTISIDTSAPGVFTVTHPLTNIYSQWEIFATVTNADGITADIHITQNPPIRLLRQGTTFGNVFVNGYFARVSPRPDYFTGNTYRYRDNGDNQYYWHSASLWSTGNTTAGQINNTTQTKNGRTTGSYGTVMGSTSNLDSSIDRNYYTTEITVSSFNSSNDFFVANGDEVHYRIGDPRVPSSAEYTGSESWTNNNQFYDMLYYNGNTTELFRPWESPESILISSQQSDDQSIIAPRFLVSSALNAMSGGVTFDNAVKRGATYQEAGYPAGRWRLPTEAEMAFIVARQKEGVIPTLYATNTNYWSGSGRALRVPAGANENLQFSDQTGSMSCRFVYDLWYWGDEASTTTEYHPEGHIYDYDASGNRTARTL